MITINFNRKIIIILILLCLTATILILLVYSAIISEHVPKQKIIDSFNKNEDKFVRIIDYFETDKGYSGFYYNSEEDKFIYKNFNDDKEIGIVIDDDEIKEICNFVLKDLKFSAINEGKDYILFSRENSPYEQGIMYLKNGLKSGGFDDEIYIKGNWYYYLKTYT